MSGKVCYIMIYVQYNLYETLFKRELFLLYRPGNTVFILKNKTRKYCRVRLQNPNPNPNPGTHFIGGDNTA